MNGALTKKCEDLTFHEGLRSVLVANRGEVALRVLRACRELSIQSVAVYSSADRDSAHVQQADCAVELPGEEPKDTYLNADLIVATALRLGVDGVHPGYGFLAENADFALAVEKAGLVFIGPGTETIALMGDKARARAHVQALGIPVIPGAQPSGEDPVSLQSAAVSVGFPLLIKATAGGGGMGMRVVEREEDLAGSIDAVQREALNAFGQGQVLFERLLRSFHHIEIQLISDGYGGHYHAFERECSVQRRRQKVVEESPSPNIDGAMRERLCDAAISIARSVEYRGLGTVEFMVRPDSGEFYFLEMNTRLQVEHAITEQVTGLDLVHLQLAIAAKEPVAITQEQIGLHGHAVECRWYAEDPSAGFTPTGGTVLRWRPRTGQHGRIESALIDGAVIGSHYDPMLAKVVGWGETRSAAIRCVDYALSKTTLQGVQSNQRFLRRVLRDEQFLRGVTPTEFLDQRRDLLEEVDEVDASTPFLALAFWLGHRDNKRLRALGYREVSHYYRCGGDRRMVITPVGAPMAETEGVALRLRMGQQVHEVQLLSPGTADPWLLSIDGTASWFEFSQGDGAYEVSQLGKGNWLIQSVDGENEGARSDQGGPYRAPMPCRVLVLYVEEGALVAKGERLLTLESMKMEHTIFARNAGRVTDLRVAEGSSVEKGGELLSLQEEAL